MSIESNRVDRLVIGDMLGIGGAFVEGAGAATAGRATGGYLRSKRNTRL